MSAADDDRSRQRTCTARGGQYVAGPHERNELADRGGQRGIRLGGKAGAVIGCRQFDAPIAGSRGNLRCCGKHRWLARDAQFPSGIKLRGDAVDGPCQY
jgi:hypothetical protein